MSTSYIQIVEQAIDLLETMSPQDYQKVLSPHFTSSIGAHVRHVIDHFQAVIDGSISGHVDYNVRHRECQAELYPHHAIDKLLDVVRWLEQVTVHSKHQMLNVTSDIDGSSSSSLPCQSTLERELVFVSSHAIHHYALIKVICGLLNKPTPALFGYAPATISHIHQSA